MSATRFRTFLACAPGLERALGVEVQRIGALVACADGVPSTPHVSKARLEQGGVEVWLSREALWAACHYARCVERVRVRLGSGGATHRATDFRTFRAIAARLPWAAFYAAGVRLHADVRATASKSKLIHSGALEERVFAALAAKYDVVNAPTRYTFEERRGADDDDEDGGDAKAVKGSGKPTGKPVAAGKPTTVVKNAGGATSVAVSVRVDHDVCEFSVDAALGAGDEGALHRRGCVDCCHFDC